MGSENSLNLLLSEWGSIPIPSDPQSEIQPIGLAFAQNQEKVTRSKKRRQKAGDFASFVH
jgi:hypothetical protein